MDAHINVSLFIGGLLYMPSAMLTPFLTRFFLNYDTILHTYSV